MSETPLISLQGITQIANARPLFQNISLGIFEKERVGIIGPNGAGKSTLLKILAGVAEPEKGQRTAQKSTTVGYVPQEVDFPEHATVEDFLAWSLRRTSLSREEVPVQTAIAVNHLSVDPKAILSQLSGGWQKKVAIMGELIKKTSILFLDEPTNHLDFKSIRWLEKELRSYSGALVLISHDRSFLEKVCNRTLEINSRYQNGYFSCEGNYSHFLQRRSEYLLGLQQYEQSLANKVRREVAWLRQGVKARTTKSKSRIKSAHEMQEKLEQTRSQLAERSSKIEFTETGRKTKKLIELKEVDFAHGDKKIFSDFSYTLRNGSRLGLLGNNGSGKSTLLNLITKKLQPQKGEIFTAEDCRVVYFQQDRSLLDSDKSLCENLCDDGDSVHFQGRLVHVASYAKRFLFKPEQLHLPTARLSGGERARLLIAKLMLQPADVLLLDEPTNDLDIETMEVFAENLDSFQGAVVLVSHDRYFLDQICDTFLSISPDAPSQVYSSIEQWEANLAKKQSPSSDSSDSKAAPEKKKKMRPKRLSYKEKREWEQMEEKILVAEEALEIWKKKVEDLSSSSAAQDLREAFEKMGEAQGLVDQLYERWAELESQQDGR